MKKDYTHITVILDRSGSMESIREDVIGGFNAFLGEQQRAPGMATLTLVQFDTQNPYEVLANFQLIGTVPPLTRELYVPRASTPLLDAIGRGINDLEATLAKMSEAERPEKIIFLIVTDGQENASREFTRAKVAELISMHEEKNNWQFVYISADLAAVREAESIQFRKEKVMAFDKTGKGTADAMRATSVRIAEFRNVDPSPSAAPSLAFTDEDRAQQEAEKLRKQ